MVNEGITLAKKFVIGFVALLILLLFIGTQVYEAPPDGLYQAADDMMKLATEVERVSRKVQMERLLNAIAIVESQGDPNAVGVLDEVGRYQLRMGYVKDVERIVGGDIRWSAVISRAYVEVYLNHYATYERLGYEPTLEEMARIHNGGPNGHINRSTEPYWFKVKAVLDGWE